MKEGEQFLKFGWRTEQIMGEDEKSKRRKHNII